MPETAPPRSRICLRPPALKTSGRLGLAHSRSLGTSTLASCLGAAGAAVALGCSLGTATTWRPAVAGALGAASFLGSLSSLATCADETLAGRGTGYSLATLARCPYVYVLPYASWSWRKRPRRLLAPMR